MPMMLRRNRSFFELKDARLLRSIPNEVLNGFVVDDFEAAIGIRRAELQDLLTQQDRLIKRANRSVIFSARALASCGRRKTIGDH